MSSGLDKAFNYPVLGSSRRQSISLVGVIASDFIRFWPIAAMLAGIGFLLSLTQYIDKLHVVNEEMILKGYHALCGLMAFVVGLGCGNDDRERGTLWMLRALPFSTKRLLAEKFAVCILLIALFLLLTEIVMCTTSVTDFGSFFTTLGSMPYPSPWKFGTSWALSAAQFFCLALVGLSAGVRFSNFVTAAIAGLAVYAAWYSAWILICHPLEFSNASLFRSLMVLQQLLLAGAAGFGFTRFARYFSNGYLATSSEATNTPTQKALSIFRWNFRLPGESHVSPYRGRLIGTALWLSLIVWAVMFTFWPVAQIIKINDLGFILLTPVLAAAFLGCLVFNRNELVGFRGQLYFQPVSRWALLRPRVILLGICTLIMASMPLLLSGFLGNLALSVLPFIALGSACLATTLRFLFRNAIFATIITCVIIGFWTLLTFVGNTVMAVEMQTSATMAYLVWLMAVFALWPLTCLYLAFVKSSLLSLGGTARSFLGISAALTIFAVGCLLVAMNPIEVIWLILNWIETAGAGVGQ